MYMMILLLALYTGKPADGDPQIIEEAEKEEVKEELIDKEEMLKGELII